MKLLQCIAGLAIVVLAGCGGGGGNASAPAPLSPASAPALVVSPASVEVLTDSTALQSAGSEAVITAFVKNSSNVGLPGQSVTFSASSGTLQGPSATTDATGAATAKLIAGSDKSLRDITVTVTAGAAIGRIVVPVIGTRISVAGAGSMQAGGAAAQYTVRAIDSSGNPIAGAAISLRSTLGNPVSATTLTTASTGSATFSYTPNTAGTDELTLTGLGATTTTAVIVNAIDFVVSSPASNTLIDIGASKTVTVRYKLSGVGVAGQTVAFSTTRGIFAVSTNVTDGLGEASAVLSSTTAGPATVVAQIARVGVVNLPVQFVATQPASMVVQANPGSILPNASGTTNQSTIEAVVRDVNGNAVANTQVNFSALQDLSGGTLMPGNATTDANGRAQVQFISGATSTAANGVVIQGEVALTAIKSSTTLTVNGKALFITFAFGNEISNVDSTTYGKSFGVYVTDANGVAVGNQLITLSVIPTEYYKGRLVDRCASVLVSGCSTLWIYAVPPTVCPNEDIDLNGILNLSEDINGDGLLTPGNIALAAPGQVTTDALGRAAFVVQYGEQFAPWATVRITARAAVAGTESRQSILFDLRGSTPDFTSETPPAGRISPFGSSALCTDWR
jgi:hypothetical protein